MTSIIYNRNMLDTIIHNWLRLPYRLHVGVDEGPRRPEVTLVFIHGLANSHAMWEGVIKHIDKRNVRIICVDLLGFGASPKPGWATYHAALQARALRHTLRVKRIRTPVVLVGHSLGSLVAIQYASHYPKHVDSLLLCSPPFYKPSRLAKDARIGIIKQTDDAYHLFYRNSRHRKEIAVRLAMIVKAARLTSKHFVINQETLPAIVSSLEMSIENQTALDDAKWLKIPVSILYGQFDPFVIKGRIRELKKANENVTTTILPVWHEIAGRIYRKAILSTLDKIVKDVV